MEVVLLLLALIALAAASAVWGVDSRDDAASSRPRRWFIELDGRASADVDRHPSGGRLYGSAVSRESGRRLRAPRGAPGALDAAGGRDRKSTRLNSSHGYISYAVFCLKKKKKKQ